MAQIRIFGLNNLLLTFKLIHYLELLELKKKLLAAAKMYSYRYVRLYIFKICITAFYTYNK